MAEDDLNPTEGHHEDAAPTELGTKLDMAPVGIVTEEARQILLMAEYEPTRWITGDSIVIRDETHYVTSGWTVEQVVTISSTPQSLWYLKDPADGYQELGREADDGEDVLGYFETGDRLEPKKTYAPGRRIKLPWGRVNFDITLLTDDGRTIMKRSIEWAAGVEQP